MNLSRYTWIYLFISCFTFRHVNAEDAGDDVYDDGAAGDDGGDGGNDAADDGGNQNKYYNDEDDDGNHNDDYIKYWSEYAILSKRCIVYNNVDVIVFSMYAHGYKQCSDEPMGTYIVPVPKFIDAYMDQLAQDQSDQGNDDFVAPDAAQYTQCTGIQIQNNQYYVQAGCTDEDTQSISANIYTDATCETRSIENGYDDSNIDLSELQLPLKKCKACVVWVDKNDDEIDDMFYENRRKQAPLCSQVWEYKDECDKKCRKMKAERVLKEGWNTSDKILLVVLSLFGCGMLIAILRKRQNMSNKDALLEQAAMSAAGLQQVHVVAIFVLGLVIITIFASLRMKAITWAMLLLLNLTLFAYLMKLTVDSGVEDDHIVGPDGTITRIDSDESSIASNASGIPPIS